MTHRDGMVAVARRWIGTPYRHQAALEGVGCDCLGLLRGVLAEVTGARLEEPPPYTPDWADTAPDDPMRAAALRHLREIDPAAAEAGDVLLFRWRRGLPAKHCAIVSGPERMIHAWEGAAVAETSIGPWWRRHLAGAFELPEETTP
jgi:NlpC/P60 family putative phage cell wall peptidase